MLIFVVYLDFQDFSTNEWNVPCCFFDATNEKEWKKWMVDSGKYAKKWGSVSIKKIWRNPELDQGTKQ